MHKKLYNLIFTKFVNNDKLVLPHAFVHKYVNEEKNVVIEATDSRILIRATRNTEEDFKFDICENIEGVHTQSEKFPNVDRVLSGLLSEKVPISIEDIQLFIVQAEVAHKMKQDYFDCTIKDIEYCLTSKLAKIVASALDIILKDKKDKIQSLEIHAKSSIKPILFVISTTWYTYEIALTPVRKKR